MDLDIQGNDLDIPDVEDDMNVHGDELEIPAVDQNSNTHLGSPETTESTPIDNITSWLPHLHIITTLNLGNVGTLDLITRRSLRDKWGGDTTRKVSVTMQYDWRF